jgi:hypothetical protein
MTPRTLLKAAVLVAASALTVACGPAFTIDTPQGMLELKNQSGYAYRAMSPDGLVLAVRVIDEPGKTDAAFWTQAVSLRLKERPDYSLLSTADVTSASGAKGKELRFRHDEKGKAYLYVVRIFAEPDHPLVIVEAGGLQGDMRASTIDAAMASLRLK